MSLVFKMIKFSNLVIILGFTVLVCCKPRNNSDMSSGNQDVDVLLENRYKMLLDYPIDSMAFPRTMTVETGQIQKVPSKDWTSGFFVGNLWQLYQLTKDEVYKERAKLWTAFIEKEKFNDKTHDMGFKVFCSFGKGLEVENNETYKNIIVESAQTLSTRFNPKVGAIRSWDFNSDIWEFPVIIDNMLNLELLFEATKISGDSTFHKIAVAHANTTLKNHFRSDNSTWHVVVYDTIAGSVKDKLTHQGFSNESSWARGQGWAIYGYTMAYRYTKDIAYLKQAEATANFFMNHKNLPEDGIPYWDFNDPSIPNAPKDVSAATLVASGLVELYRFTKNEAYLNYSKKVVNSLKSTDFILDDTVKGPFVLNHSTGNWPKNDEVNEPIVYADYYYLETILRIKAL